MLVIKRKLYSKSFRSSLRIKRFSQIKEEERLYAINPFATIRRVNTLRTANNAYKGLNFRQALSQYRQRGQLATTARSIHKPMVSSWAKNGKLDYRSLQGGILSGNNLGKSNLVGLSAGVKQASSNISSNVRNSSGGGLFKNLFRSNKSTDSIMRGDIFKTANQITSQHITQPKNLVSSLKNAGVTNANIGNLTGAQKNQLLNPALQKPTYNSVLDPKTLNINFMGSGQIPVQKGTKQQTLIDNRGFEKVNKSQRRTSNSVLNQEANQLSKNNQKGQSYYDSVFKETGANANSTYNITTSRKDLMNQMKPTPQTITTNKPQEIAVDNKTVGFNEAKLQQQSTQNTTSNPIEKNINEFVNMDKGNMKVETPKQPAKKPFEITGLAEQQPKPQTTSPTVESTGGGEKYKIARVGKDEKGNLKIDKQPSETTVNSSVENTNPNPQTPPPAEQPKPEVKPENKPNNPPQNPENPTTTTDTNKKKEDEKFKLGWKGKAALGTLALGGAAYGGAKLVNDAIDDQDKRS